MSYAIRIAVSEVRTMRGDTSGQQEAFSYLNLEERVPADHPLRTIRARAQAALKRLSPLFDQMYASGGRPSIPPERLLMAQLLIALYSVRSDRQFCESLGWNLLFRWFLGMTLDEPGFVQSTFSKNRERLLEHEVAPRFFRRGPAPSTGGEAVVGGALHGRWDADRVARLAQKRAPQKR
jgi:transposase